MLTETTGIPMCNTLSDPSSSLSRLEKGFNYEHENWSMLDVHAITYESNPQTFEEWCKHTNTDYDIRVKTLKKGWIRVECKFTLKHIYHSWFMRDWYSRDCDIIVTNNKLNVRYEDRKLLKETGRKLMNTYEFLNYILKLCKRGNKYLVFEYPRINNIGHELLYNTALITVYCVLALIFYVLKASGIKFSSHLILIPWTSVDCLSKFSQCRERATTTERRYSKGLSCERCYELHSRLFCTKERYIDLLFTVSEERQ